MINPKIHHNQYEVSQQEQQRQTIPPSSTTMDAAQSETNESNRLDIQNTLANRFLTGRNILIAQEVSNLARDRMQYCTSCFTLD